MSNSIIASRNRDPMIRIGAREFYSFTRLQKSMMKVQETSQLKCSIRIVSMQR